MNIDHFKALQRWNSRPQYRKPPMSHARDSVGFGVKPVPFDVACSILCSRHLRNIRRSHL